jgi:hypothetical protein
VGDWVKIEGAYGEVTWSGLRSFRLVTPYDICFAALFIGPPKRLDTSLIVMAMPPPRAQVILFPR